MARARIPGRPNIFGRRISVTIASNNQMLFEALVVALGPTRTSSLKNPYATRTNSRAQLRIATIAELHKEGLSDRGMNFK